jgi:hypothetical protein
MDAKKLNSGKKIESKLIPLLNDDRSVSNIFDSILQYSGKLKGQETDKSQLKYAVDHLKDAGRMKEYTKIIADNDKWTIPEAKIIDVINFVRIYILSPIFNDGYGAERRKAERILETKKELSKIHNLINDVEAGSIDTLEITLKATSKSVPNNIPLESDIVVTKIFECLKSLLNDFKSLPNFVSFAEINQNPKGRPKGIEPETRQQKYCANKIREEYSSLFDSQNDLYEFTGLCFVAAGIYQTESDYNIEFSNSGKYDSYRDYLISKIKSLFG